MPLKDLRRSPMLSHLLDALGQGKDIGHYGRLTLAMVAHHYLDKQELADLLAQGNGADEREIRALVQQATERGYNPPKRERILEWQAQQDFAICPTPDDPNSCNVYSDLQFPDHIYENINEYHQEKIEAQEG